MKIDIYIYISPYIYNWGRELFKKEKKNSLEAIMPFVSLSLQHIYSTQSRLIDVSESYIYVRGRNKNGWRGGGVGASAG